MEMFITYLAPALFRRVLMYVTCEEIAKENLLFIYCSESRGEMKKILTHHFIKKSNMCIHTHTHIYQVKS